MKSAPQSSALEQRSIGSLEVSTIGIGCNNFGWHIDSAATAKVVDAALEAGINFFDTADVYGTGESEEYLGKALGKRRSQVVIATKFGMKLDDQRPGGARPEYLKRAAESSLSRLGTDVIDLYYLHKPDESTPIADTLGALESLKQEGKIREYACSNFSVEQLIEAREKSAAGSGFVAVQNEYSLLHREPELGVLQECQALQMAFIPYFPLKSGLLTGKYRKGQKPPEGTRLGGGNEGSQFASMGDSLLTEQNLDVVEKLISFAARHDRTVLDLAFAWLLSKTAVASVIAGASKPEQLAANVNAASWKLTADELAEVDAIVAPPEDSQG